MTAFINLELLKVGRYSLRLLAACLQCASPTHQSSLDVIAQSHCLFASGFRHHRNGKISKPAITITIQHVQIQRCPNSTSGGPDKPLCRCRMGPGPGQPYHPTHGQNPRTYRHCSFGLRVAAWYFEKPCPGLLTSRARTTRRSDRLRTANRTRKPQRHRVGHLPPYDRHRLTQQRQTAWLFASLGPALAAMPRLTMRRPKPMDSDEALPLLT